jgi:outer membrane protein assembly factor BamE (lipoprotein component of BamABCDE complex)
MRNSLNKSGISVFEWIFYLIGLLLLFVLAGLVANGQNKAPGTRTGKVYTEAPQPLYKEYRSVRLGMTAAEVRAKLGEPAMKSDEQDFYVFSASETAQVAYNAAQKVVTISTDYAGGVGAPDYKSVVGEALLLQRPDGSVFTMVMYDSERFWVSYNKSGATVPTVTITIGAYK